MTKKNSEPVSIIIPVYNEDETCELFINLLQQTLKFKFEVLIIYDDHKDSTIPIINRLEKNYKNVKGIINKIGRGAKNAFLTGLENSNYEIILLSTIDEMLVISKIDDMYEKIINNDYDLVSGTRYSKGGVRYGGFIDARIMSFVSNKILKIFTNIGLADSTTGFKMFKKKIFEKVNLDSEPIGWAFALEISVKAYKFKYKLTEVPITAVDRAFGGVSSYKNNAFKWIKEYLRWFFYCLMK